MSGFMIDPHSFDKKRERYSKVVTLYCSDDDGEKQGSYGVDLMTLLSHKDKWRENIEEIPKQESNDESLMTVSSRDFWGMTKRCKNIEVISIPGNLEMKIDTLNERLPKLKRVIIRIQKGDDAMEEHEISAKFFREFFSQKLLVGKNGVEMSYLPNNPRRPSYKIVPYIPEIYPNVEACCSGSIYEENYDYKNTPQGSGPDVLIGGYDFSKPTRPKFGRICEGIEIVQFAKDCIINQ